MALVFDHEALAKAVLKKKDITYYKLWQYLTGKCGKAAPSQPALKAWLEDGKKLRHIEGIYFCAGLIGKEIDDFIVEIDDETLLSK